MEEFQITNTMKSYCNDKRSFDTYDGAVFFHGNPESVYKCLVCNKYHTSTDKVKCSTKKKYSQKEGQAPAKEYGQRMYKCPFCDGYHLTKRKKKYANR